MKTMKVHKFQEVSTLLFQKLEKPLCVKNFNILTFAFAFYILNFKEKYTVNK